MLERASPQVWASVAVFALSGLAMVAGALGLAALTALAGMVAASGLALGDRAAFLQQPPLAAYALAALLGWAALSLVWTPHPAWENYAKLAAAAPIFAAFAIACARLRAGARLRLEGALAFGVVAAAGLFAFESLTGGALTTSHHVEQGMSEVDLRARVERSLGHGVSALVVLSPPAAVGLWASGGVGRVAALALGLIAIVAGVRFGVSSNLLGLACAMAAASSAWLAPRATLRALGVIAAGTLVAAPLLGPLSALAPQGVRDAMPLSWEMRLEIWRTAVGHIWSAPILGHGFDASRAFDGDATLRGVTFPTIPLHPHNAGLHLWLETGLVGVLLAGVALVLGLGRVADAARLTRRQAAAVAGFVGAYGGIGLTSYGVWQEWWIAVGVLAAGACLALGPARGAVDGR